MSRTVRLVTLALFLSLSLASGSHAAVGVAQQGLESFPTRLVELAIQFFSGNAKRGCQIDPFGRCLPQATTSSDLKHGCAIDPTGNPVGNCQGD